MKLTYSAYSAANAADVTLTLIGISFFPLREVNPIVVQAMALWGPAAGLVICAATAQIAVWFASRRFPRLPAILACIHAIMAVRWVQLILSSLILPSA